MVESRDELTLACHLQFNFSSAHVSRHRSTSTIITIRGRRREETHKIIRDNQFNGIHYRPRYNKSTITITIPQNQRKKKRRRRRIEQNPREREKKKISHSSDSFRSSVQDNDRISRAYIESRRSAIPTRI